MKQADTFNNWTQTIVMDGEWYKIANLWVCVGKSRWFYF